MKSKNCLYSALFFLILFVLVAVLSEFYPLERTIDKITAILQLCAFSFISHWLFNLYSGTKQREDFQRLFDFTLGEKSPLESINLIGKRILIDYPQWIEIARNEDARLVKNEQDWGKDYKKLKKTRVRLKNDFYKAKKIAINLGLYQE